MVAEVRTVPRPVAKTRMFSVGLSNQGGEDEISVTLPGADHEVSLTIDEAQAISHRLTQLCDLARRRPVAVVAVTGRLDDAIRK